jgi:hypothetical protein
MSENPNLERPNKKITDAQVEQNVAKLPINAFE